VEESKNEPKSITLSADSKENEADSADKTIKKKAKQADSQDLENNRKILTKFRIIVLKNELKGLTETKKLIEEIQEAEGTIRQKVLEHIFHNYEDIAKVKGGDVFISSIIGDDNDSTNKLDFNEAKKRIEELEKKLKEKRDDDQSSEEIEKEITEKEKELLELKKQQLSDKEVLEKWQTQRFNLQESKGWADALKNSFDPEHDASFCVWLQNDKKLTSKEVLDDSYIEQLRKEYDPQDQRSSKNTKTILLIGRSGRGKSTLANVLTGTNDFKESSTSVSETKNVQIGEFEENGTNYQVIDTPGIGDTKMSDSEVLNIIAEAIYLAKDGISQVFFVNDGRFDQYEMATYDQLRNIIFGDNFTKNTTIVRTRFPGFRDDEECQ